MHIENKGTIHIHIGDQQGIRQINEPPSGLFSAIMGAVLRSKGEKDNTTASAKETELPSEKEATSSQPIPPDGRPITERVQTFADIEAISGKKLSLRTNETSDEFAYRQAKLIAEVYNEGTVLDPTNTDQYKYYPWHKIDKSSGVGLAYGDCDRWAASSRVGVRLCFAKSEHATDAGKKFINIYANLKIK